MGQFRPAGQVFAVHGVDPEVQAYAMAKYSRSALSMKESLKEISGRRPSSFSTLSTFSMATARLPTWPTWRWPLRSFRSWRPLCWWTSNDGMAGALHALPELQKSGYFIPDFGSDEAQEPSIAPPWNFFLASMTRFTQEMLRYYTGRFRGRRKWRKTSTRARCERGHSTTHVFAAAGDEHVAGQIVKCANAEMQIARLLASPYAEVSSSGPLAAERPRPATRPITCSLNRCGRWWRRSRRPTLVGR